VKKLGGRSKCGKDTFTQSVDWFNLVCAVVDLCEHINDAFGWVGSGGGCHSYWWMVVVLGGWW
jgi:hypothetical protein